MIRLWQRKRAEVLPVAQAPQQLRDWTMAEAPNGSVKPKMQIAIEHLDRAHDHMCKAMGLISSIGMDWQKCADFIVGYRESLIKTVEATGGDVQASIEHQIRDFVPKHVRRGNNSDDDVSAQA